MNSLKNLFTNILLLTISNVYATCPQISYPGQEVGRITDPRIDEGSGLVASRKFPDVFWTLNDHNGPHHVYAVSVNGTLLTDLKLEGAVNEDWEAIATAPCSKE